MDIRPPQFALLGTSMEAKGAAIGVQISGSFRQWRPLAPAIDHQSGYFDEDEEILRNDTTRPKACDRHRHVAFASAELSADCWFAWRPPMTTHGTKAPDRLRSKMYASGIPHDCDLETSAGGHSWQYYKPYGAGGD